MQWFNSIQQIVTYESFGYMMALFSRKFAKMRLFFLKGPKHEIFESGFFTETRPVRIGDLGTGVKK